MTQGGKQRGFLGTRAASKILGTTYSGRDQSHTDGYGDGAVPLSCLVITKGTCAFIS